MEGIMEGITEEEEMAVVLGNRRGLLTWVVVVETKAVDNHNLLEVLETRAETRAEIKVEIKAEDGQGVLEEEIRGGDRNGLTLGGSWRGFWLLGVTILEWKNYCCRI